MEVIHFSDIEAEFIRRVHTMVWCNAATVDGRGRPRSRILHPIWEGSTGWIGTHRHSHKARHLVHNPYVSLAYITDIHKPVYVDCIAEWVNDLDQKRHIWDLFKSTPPPLGYDPAMEFVSVDHEDFGLLKLTPWRIDLVSFPAPSFEQGTLVWRRRANDR
jgi:general stress protein 26